MAFNKRQRQYLRGMATANANNNKANNPPLETPHWKRNRCADCHYEHKPQQQHPGKRDLLVKFIAKVPLPVTNSGQQVTGKLKEAVILADSQRRRC